MRNKLIFMIMILFASKIALGILNSSAIPMEITSVANQSADRVLVEGRNYDEQVLALEAAPYGKLIGEDLRSINPRNSVSITITSPDSPHVVEHGELVMELQGNALATTLSGGITKEGDLDGAAALKIVVTADNRIVVGADKAKTQ